MQKQVLNKMWEDDVNFGDGCDKKYLIDTGMHLPIISTIFNGDVVCFDVKNEKTMTHFAVKNTNQMTTTVMLPFTVVMYHRMMMLLSQYGTKQLH